MQREEIKPIRKAEDDIFGKDLQIEFHEEDDDIMNLKVKGKKAG
eukprot:CAMPEP_0170547234 /NCGR_PEP_ID=MMETSP0211-20121228/5597_1 /TAXON_ID=311385 /ORGANISM="Pseudokeronopsis sp., Strain OXSARD2" /LENGTH=43 /DNA_ID= /DNA_START= /DNA_END= /DNA_ORIENTATION=